MHISIRSIRWLNLRNAHLTRLYRVKLLPKARNSPKILLRNRRRHDIQISAAPPVLSLIIQINPPAPQLRRTQQVTLRPSPFQSQKLLLPARQNLPHAANAHVQRSLPPPRLRERLQDDTRLDWKGYFGLD